MLTITPLKAAAIFIILILSLFIHHKRMQHIDTGTYIKSLLGISNCRAGTAYLDYLRVIAAIMAIAVHVTEMHIGDVANPHYVYLLTVLDTLFLSCNLLFIMISGALILNERFESVSKFYVKRASKVLVPFFMYYLFYCYSTQGKAAFYPSNWKLLLTNILTASPNIPPHFWIIYVICGLYLVAPLIHYVITHVSDRALYALICVLLAVDAALTYLPVFISEMTYKLYVFQWISVFVAGYVIAHKLNRKYTKYVISAGILSFIISAFLIHSSEHYKSLIYNCSPTMIFIAAAIMLFFKQIFPLNHVTAVPIRICSKFSYSVLLIHWFILYTVLNGRLINSVPVTIAAVFLLSLLFAIIFDNTVMIIPSLFHR